MNTSHRAAIGSTPNRWAMTASWIVALGLHAGAHALGPDDAVASATSGNLTIFAGDARPAGPVAGDLVAAGGRVLVDQPVGGDAMLAGGSVDVRAPIGDDLRTAGGNVNIESTVGGELLAAGGHVAVTKSAQVQRGAALLGGLVTIDGRITGNLKVSAQRVVLNGEVTGDARIVAERIELGPMARISGALRHVSRQLDQADGATVGGAVTREEGPAPPRDRQPSRHSERQWQFSGPSWVGLVFGYLGLLAAGAVFVLVFPQFAAAAPDRIRSAPGQALASGLAITIGVPVLAVLLCITLLGIPLGLATLALYPLLLLTGYLAGVLFIAQRARRSVGAEEGTSMRSTIGFVALALLIVMLIGRLPVVGAIAGLIVTIAGLGACVLEWRARWSAEPS
jgi:cytoskeletal protein CcmA (bactofilin family)